jgi:hypothetical protein
MLMRDVFRAVDGSIELPDKRAMFLCLRLDACSLPKHCGN